MLSGKRLLILGATSFAGRCLIKQALLEGMTILGVSRSAETKTAFHLYRQLSQIKNYVFQQIDLNQHQSQLSTLLRDFKPNYVVDLAGQGMVSESWKQPQQWYQTNLVSKTVLFQELLQLDSLEKYIRVSTPEVYGSTHTAVQENTHYQPSTPYAISHAAVDQHLHILYQQFNFPMILTRFSNFYGPGQQLYRIIPRTILYARLGRQLLLEGGGESVRAFIYGEDVAHALLCTLKAGSCGQIYHFSTKNFICIRELVEKILRMQHVCFDDIVVFGEDRIGKDFQYLMSDQKARDELKWCDNVSLEQGIAQTIAWVDAYWHQLKDEPLYYQHKP